MIPGRIVYSKRGRDKGKAFVILSADGEYIYLADGDTRSIRNPKKKKQKHTQPTNTVVDLTALAGQRGLQDADIRKILKSFVKN